jgi:hypothetical protein
MTVALQGGLFAGREPFGAFALFLEIADGRLKRLRLRLSGGEKKEQSR